MNREQTPPKIEALGWERAFPQAVAQRLLREYPSLDFSNVAVVVQGSRAGRRIKAILADEAASRGLVMIPPRVCTTGALLSDLVEFSKPLAGAFARRAAWARGLMAMDESVRSIIFPHPPVSDDFPGWFRVAGLLEQSQKELASAALSFAAAAKETGKKNIGDVERWRAAAEAESAYLAELNAAGLSDEQHDRNEAISSGRVRVDAASRIILAGVSQMTPQMRKALAAAREQGAAISVWIYADQDWTGHFDEWGCVRPAAWAKEILPIERADVRVAERAQETAQEIFRAIGESKTPPRVDDLTIGILDESLVPFVEAEAEMLGGAESTGGRQDAGGTGIPVRWGVGKSIATARPYQLLSVVAGFLESRRFRHFVLLVRHPDFRKWISLQWAAEKKGSEPEWPALLDEYAGQFIPDMMDGGHSALEGWRHAEKFDVRAELAWLHAKAIEFSAAEGAAAAQFTLNELAPRILTPLRLAYGEVAWNQNEPADHAVVAACFALREGAEELWKHAIAPEETRATHAEGIRILLSLASGERIVPAFTGAQIDMVGWLELMPDDAPRIIIAAFNEGNVPETSRPDSFLTNSVRSALGLADDAERYARDAYLLTAMLMSRPNGSVTLIAGKTNADGDPLLPSRLLLAGKRDELAKRVLAFADSQTPRRPLKYRAAIAAEGGGAFGGIPILPAEKILAPTEISVTAFRDYLGSPKGFYLKRLHNRRGIETIKAETPRELGVLDFGTLVHEVLKETMTPEASGTVASAGEWNARLMEALKRHVAGVYGNNLTASLRFQVKLLEKRLAKLAQWQEERGKTGWRIIAREKELEAEFVVDGVAIKLKGKIDRIDKRVGDDGEEYAILDYKICAGDKTPEKSHQKSGAWVDLQLPLYKILAAEIIAGKKVSLGYVRLADDPDYVGGKMAEWTEEEIAAAHEEARRVVREIRARHFEEEGDDPPADGIFGHIFGADVLKIEEGGDE